MTAPQYVMLAMLLLDGMVIALKGYKRDNNVASSIIAAFTRIGVITAVLAWGGFWEVLK